MGKYDNYSNIKNIKKAQKNLDRLTRKRKPDLFKIELAQAELDAAKLFESCQIFKAVHGFAPNENVMFSDDNKVMMFYDTLIRYEDIQSYQIVERALSKSRTVTKQQGAVSRAIIGGAIAGGVGALVGAASAGSSSDTTYYQERNGFFFQIFLKDGSGGQWVIPSIRDLTNKIHPRWLDVGTKIQMIIDGKI